MKRVLVSVLTFIGIFLLLGGGTLVFWFYHKYVPSKEMANQQDWFQVAGNQVAIMLNNELIEDTKGRWIDGEVYLPLEWVQKTLNEKFYWDNEEKLLIYTLPEEIIYADTSVMGKDRKSVV